MWCDNCRERVHAAGKSDEHDLSQEIKVTISGDVMVIARTLGECDDSRTSP